MKIIIEFDNLKQLQDIKKVLNAAESKILKFYYVSETAPENVEIIQNRIQAAISSQK